MLNITNSNWWERLIYNFNSLYPLFLQEAANFVEHIHLSKYYVQFKCRKHRYLQDIILKLNVRFNDNALMVY